MSTLAATDPLSVRRKRQRRVAELLDEIAARRHRLNVLKAYGVRPAGLRVEPSHRRVSPALWRTRSRAPKAEFAAVRNKLAEVVDTAPTTP